MAAKLKLLVLTSLLALFATFLGSAEENGVAGEALFDQTQALKLFLYDLGWIRYHNQGASGQPKLSAAESVVFPYQRYNNGNVRLRLSDLEKPGAIAQLVAAHEIAYDEATVVGNCDPNRIAQSVFCVPGTRDMEIGQIFLALFDPNTYELAALTTTIDNGTGAAAVPNTWLVPMPDEPAEGAAPPVSQPPPDETADIDNCCQIGWRCSTERHWTNGYWAFQNNQCSAARIYSTATDTQGQPESNPGSESGRSRQSSSSSSSTQSSSQPSMNNANPPVSCSLDGRPCCWMQLCGIRLWCYVCSNRNR